VREFEFLEPASVPEASRMLAAHGDDARVIAGGTALLLGMRQRMLAPTHLVSLGRIAALCGLRYDERQGLRIGALTLHAELARAPVVRERYPMLAHMAAHLANPQIRNQGTIGGNLCYADPATDPPTCLMALDAVLTVSGTKGERTLAVEDFVVDYYTTALEPDEIVTEIRVPPPASGHAGRYTRFKRTAAEHRPLVNVAIATRADGARCLDARVVVGASVPIPARVPRAEELLRGRTVTPELAAEAADAAAADIFALSDTRGSEEYRRDMVRVVVRRTLAGLFDLPQD
jgi:carbon-monoxide dehydrogenase medium subunit